MARPVELGEWCQVRISPALARRVARLPRGAKSEAVRLALEAACTEHGIPATVRVDRRQLALPISKRRRAKKAAT